MKQILLASAALLAVNGQQHLRRSAPVSDVIRPHILPVDLEPTIPENPILQPNYPITDIPEVPEIKADEFTAIPERLRPAIPERPSFNETHIPLNITKLPIYNVTLNATRPILRLPITIDPIERPIRITDPVLDYAIAADEELISIPPRLQPAIPERPIDFIPFNGTIDFPFNGTIKFPHFNETFFPIDRPIERPIYIDDPIEEPIAIAAADVADDELIVKLNATMIIDRFPNFNRTFNGTIDPRPAIPERPRPIDRIPLIPLTTTIAADDELTAIPERLRPAIPERPIDRIPIITDPIRPIPIPTIIDPSVRPIPIPTIIDPRVRPMPVSGTVIAAAADDELIVTPEILRPAIPERPIIKIPITIDPMERQPIPVIITDPPMRPIVVTDDDQLAIASF